MAQLTEILSFVFLNCTFMFCHFLNKAFPDTLFKMITPPAAWHSAFPLFYPNPLLFFFCLFGIYHLFPSNILHNLLISYFLSFHLPLDQKQG